MRFRCTECHAINVMDLTQSGTLIKCGKCGVQLTVPSSVLSSGVVLGDFVILQVWNQHNYEIDFLAEQVSLRRQCILKIPKLEYQQNTSLMDRFIDTVRKIASFRHPYHANLIMLGKENNVVYVARSHDSRESLKQHLVNQGTLSWQQATKWVIEITDVLYSAWNQCKLSHLNLKPDYINLDPYGHVQVFDIGMAVFKIDEDDEKVIGTPQYISPERIVGLEGDFRSDLYSLGIIFFLMVTGELPYPGKKNDEFIYHHLHTKPRNVSEIIPSVPAELDRIIGKMLEKDPNLRYSCGTDLIKDLEKLLWSESTVIKEKKDPSKIGTTRSSTSSVASAVDQLTPQPLKPGTLKVRIEQGTPVILSSQSGSSSSSSSKGLEGVTPVLAEGIKVKPPTEEITFKKVTKDFSLDDEIEIIEDNNPESVQNNYQSSNQLDYLLNTPITAQLPSAAAIKRVSSSSQSHREAMVLPALGTHPQNEEISSSGVQPAIPVVKEKQYESEEDVIEVIEDNHNSESAPSQVVFGYVEPPSVSSPEEEKVDRLVTETPQRKKQHSTVVPGKSAIQKKKKFITRAGLKTHPKL